MKPRFFRSNPRWRSFSLVELLVVLVIISIVAAISVATFNQVSRAGSLSTGTQIFKGDVENARQAAITRNAAVEFRVYQTPNDAAGYFSGYQSFLVTSSGTNALTKPVYFPGLVRMSANANLTSFAKISVVTGGSLGQPIPIYNENYNALVFRFAPTGRLQLDPTQAWFATLLLYNDPVQASGLPVNYSVVQIDPVSGQCTIYRP